MNEIRDIKETKYGVEGVVDFVLFGKPIKVAMSNHEEMPYAQRCADMLNSMPPEVIAQICAASTRYCNAIVQGTDQTYLISDDPMNVLKTINPCWLSIPLVPESDEPVVHVKLYCEWEQEHGMDWIIRGVNVLFVGPCESGDPLSPVRVDSAWNFA